MLQKILVFDDHALVYDGIRLQLGDEYELHHAPNGAALRAKMQEHRFDAVVVDLDFPANESGFDYLPEIKASGAKVMVLTGTATDAKLRRCFHSQIDAVLEKHDGNTDLRRAFAAVLAGQNVLPFTRIQRLLSNPQDRLPYMTAREVETLDLIFADPGIGIKQLSAKLVTSESRAGALVAQLSEKFCVLGVARLYLEAVRRGYAPANAPLLP
jgi:DNA-binding NarL/FixJ family response regulator